MAAKKKLASFFESGPVDDLITIDAYKVKKQEILNSLPSSLTNAADSAAKKILRDPKMLKKLTGDIIKMSRGEISKMDALQKIAKQLGGGSLLKDITSKVQGTVFETLSSFGVSQAQLQDVLFLGKEGYSAYARGDLKDLQGISKLLGKITGRSDLLQVLDIATEVAIFSTTFDYLVKSGMATLIPDIMSSVKDKAIVKRVYSLNVRVTIANSNLPLLNEIIDKIGVGGVLAQVPDATKLLLTHYKSPSRGNPAEQTNELNAIVNTMVRLDPDWDNYTRNGVVIKDLTPFTYASRAARTLFESDPRWFEVALVAPLYRTERLVNLYKKMYPKAAV